MLLQEHEASLAAAAAERGQLQIRLAEQAVQLEAQAKQLQAQAKELSRLRGDKDSHKQQFRFIEQQCEKEIKEAEDRARGLSRKLAAVQVGVRTAWCV